MGFETLSTKTSAALDELKIRVAHALQRHPLCRKIQFDVIRTPRTCGGNNWTVSLRSIEPRAVWQASDIVADIHDAYELLLESSTAALSALRRNRGPFKP